MARKMTTRVVKGVTQKKCTSCGKFKPLDEEHFRPLKTGWQGMCRTCERAFDRKRWTPARVKARRERRAKAREAAK